MLERLADPEFNPAGTVILEEAPGIALPVTPPLTGSKAEVVLHKHNRVKINVEMPENGLLFLSDVFYPGWKVYVDGNPARIYRANYLFRAVEVKKGHHTVEFYYEPLSFRLGAVVSLLFVVGIVMWVVVKKFTALNTQIK